jgi:hypothetical protein
LAISEVIADTHDRIKSWLTEEGLFKEELQSKGLYIQIMAEFPRGSGRHLSLVQPRDHEDMIVVFSRIVLADVHQKAFSALPQKKKEQLLWQMRYDLLFQESSFEIEPNGADMRSIRFTREIYYDGLTKNKLMEAVRENFKCELYVVWKFQEIFGEGLKDNVSKPPEPMYG